MSDFRFSQVEVVDDRVNSIAGDDSEEVRSRFAREAESLQSKASLIGAAIGMSALSGAAITREGGSLAFRFARSSEEHFDAAGILIEGRSFSTTSLSEKIS